MNELFFKGKPLLFSLHRILHNMLGRIYTFLKMNMMNIFSNAFHEYGKGAVPFFFAILIKYASVEFLFSQYEIWFGISNFFIYLVEDFFLLIRHFNIMA